MNKKSHWFLYLIIVLFFITFVFIGCEKEVNKELSIKESDIKAILE